MPNFKEYAKYYDLAHKDKDYKKEADFVYLWANHPKLIVDLGCGTGQHAKYWCKKSRVIGIDDSKEMLRRAYKHKNITYYHDRIEDHAHIAPCITALFNVAGYCYLRKILQTLCQGKGEFFIFDCWIRNGVKPAISVKYMGEFLRVAQPVKIIRNNFTLKIWVFKNLSEPLEETHCIHLYTKPEIRMLCREFGYKIEEMDQTAGWNWWFKLVKL